MLAYLAPPDDGETRHAEAPPAGIGNGAVHPVSSRRGVQLQLVGAPPPGGQEAVVHLVGLDRGLIGRYRLDITSEVPAPSETYEVPGVRGAGKGLARWKRELVSRA